MRTFIRKRITCVIIVGFACISLILLLIFVDSDESNLRKNVYERTEKDSLFKKYIMDEKYTTKQRILHHEN